MTDSIHPIIETAYKNQTDIIFTEVGCWSQNEEKYNINYSNIATILIQNVGRFCENYASDFLITWKRVEKSIYLHEKNREIIIFGIRKSGVDHDTYLISNVNTYKHHAGYIENYYRKILALEIRKTDPENRDGCGDCIRMELKDITHHVRFVDSKNTPYETRKLIKEGFTLTLNRSTKNNQIAINFTSETESGEPQAWLHLSDDSFIEIIHNENGLKPDKQFFSVKQHCAADNYAAYEATAGIITAYTTKTNTIKELKEILNSVLENLDSQHINVTQ